MKWLIYKGLRVMTGQRLCVMQRGPSGRTAVGWLLQVHPLVFTVDDTACEVTHAGFTCWRTETRFCVDHVTVVCSFALSWCCSKASLILFYCWQRRVDRKRAAETESKDATYVSVCSSLTTTEVTGICEAFPSHLWKTNRLGIEETFKRHFNDMIKKSSPVQKVVDRHNTGIAAHLFF